MRTILSKLRLDLGIRRDSGGGLDDDLGSEMTSVSSLGPHNTLDDSRKHLLNNSVHEPSETSSTSYKFDETTEMMSTVRSQRNEEEMDGLSTTQALEQYQMDITRADNRSRSEVDQDEKAASDKMVNGHAADLKSPGQLSQADSESETLTPRRLSRKTSGQSSGQLLHGTPTPSVHEMPSSSVQRTYSSSMQATPSALSHSLQSVPATPTHGPRPRPRDRRHAVRDKQSSVTDDDCSSVKGSEVSVSISEQKIDVELKVNNRQAQVDLSSGTTKPRARARRHSSREDRVLAVEEELTHEVKGSDSRNDHLKRTNMNNKQDVIQHKDSSVELADKLQTDLTIHDSSSQQNHDISPQTTKHDEQGEHQSIADVEEQENDEYDDDYEDDYDADEDDAHGDTTHRTSDDDF